MGLFCSQPIYMISHSDFSKDYLLRANDLEAGKRVQHLSNYASLNGAFNGEHNASRHHLPCFPFLNYFFTAFCSQFGQYFFKSRHYLTTEDFTFPSAPLMVVAMGLAHLALHSSLMNSGL